MSTWKGALAAAGIALAATVPAVAADGGMEDGMALVMNLEGNWSMAKMSPRAAGMMKNAKPLKSGMVVFMQNGRLYTASDRRGNLYQQRRDWMMSGS
jgi:hypothetical protein